MCGEVPALDLLRLFAFLLRTSELLSLLLKLWFGPLKVASLGFDISEQALRTPSELCLAKVTRESEMSTMFSGSLTISLFSCSRDPRCRVFILELEFSVVLMLYSDSTV